jgi:prefoldin subunit 5
VILEFDENGLITNYTEVMTKLWQDLDAEITKANKDGNASESEQERIDEFEKRATDLQSAIDQYDETRTTIDDLDNQIDD